MPQQGRWARSALPLRTHTLADKSQVYLPQDVTAMARHADLTLAADLPVFFAHPHSPWERGTNENTNRLIGEYLPKGTEVISARSSRVRVA
jgi:IS30 family transposase